jgi:hypothetical protein
MLTVSVVSVCAAMGVTVASDAAVAAAADKSSSWWTPFGR